LIWTTNKYTLSSSMWWKKNEIVIPDTQTGETNLEIILKKALFRFHTLDDLEVAQFDSDAIIIAFEANCH